MPAREFWDHDYSRRVAEALEGIERILRHHFHQPTGQRINVMPLPTGPVAPGTADTATATFVDAAGATVEQPVTWSSSDETVLTVSGDGASGVSVGSWNAVGVGTAVLQASATNSDGSVVNTGENNPFTFTVSAPADLGVAVNVV